MLWQKRRRRKKKELETTLETKTTTSGERTYRKEKERREGRWKEEIKRKGWQTIAKGLCLVAPS